LAQVDGRVSVVVGVSAAGFAPINELATSAMDAGASGVMVAPPAQVRSDDHQQPKADDVASVCVI
jgi:4-hydroxy-tetrahydrodipicolinate synthase